MTSTWTQHGALPPGHVRAIALYEGAGRGAIVVSAILHKVAEESLYVIWDTTTRQGRVVEATQQGRPGTIAFLLGGAVLTGTLRQAASPGTLALWSPDMTRVIARWPVRLLRVVEPGVALILTREAELQRWRIEPSGAHTVLARYPDPLMRRAVTQSFRPPLAVDGERVLAVPGQDVFVSAVLEPTFEVGEPVRVDAGVSRVFPIPGGREVVVFGLAGEVEVWDGAAGRRLEVVEAPSSEVVETHARLIAHGGRALLATPLASGALALLDVAARRWVCEVDADVVANAGPVDVVHHDSLRGQLYISHMNERLKALPVGMMVEGSYAPTVFWTGVHPITAVASGAFGLICGDQGGAVTFIASTSTSTATAAAPAT